MPSQTLFKNKILLIAALSVSMGVLQAPALAQDTTKSPTSDARFQIEKDGNGFVRLDRKTGETSYCKQISGRLICKLALEERNVFHKEITALQDEIATLQKKVDLKTEDHSDIRPSKKVPKPGTKEGMGESDLFEEELDRAMDITKKTMRKLFNVVKDLQKDFEERDTN